MATIRDVAEKVGVSPSTVSRVLNGRRGYCSESTRRRVLDAARRLNYCASAPARALVQGKTNVVAIGCESPDDPHPAQMLAAAQRLAESHGFHVLLSPAEDSSDLVRILREQRADIVLWARSAVELADGLLDAVSNPQQVVVAAGPANTAPPQGIFAAYWIDWEGIRSALQHLAALGHRRIAFLAGAGQGKDEMFKVEAAKLKLQMHVVYVDSEVDKFAAGADMAQHALRLQPRPTALFARNDEFAIGALHGLNEAGVNVPDDISVVGYGGIPATGYCHPPLTTVYTPFLECGTIALQAALQACTSNTKSVLQPATTKLETHLMVRATTAPPPRGQ